MSQSTLAEALGLTFQQVQKYEKGANRIGASRLQHIAQILQMPVEYFFEGLPQERGPRRTADDATPDRAPTHQSFHANPKRKASAIHRQSCRATRRLRRSVNPAVSYPPSLPNTFPVDLFTRCTWVQAKHVTVS
jgi:transcriptional regulator with XRE-family HTH domain